MASKKFVLAVLLAIFASHTIDAVRHTSRLSVELQGTLMKEVSDSKELTAEVASLKEELRESQQVVEEEEELAAEVSSLKQQLHDQQQEEDEEEDGLQQQEADEETETVPSGSLPAQAICEGGGPPPPTLEDLVLERPWLESEPRCKFAGRLKLMARLNSLDFWVCKSATRPELLTRLQTLVFADGVTSELREAVLAEDFIFDSCSERLNFDAKAVKAQPEISFCKTSSYIKHD